MEITAKEAIAMIAETDLGRFRFVGSQGRLALGSSLSRDLGFSEI